MRASVRHPAGRAPGNACVWQVSSCELRFTAEPPNQREGSIQVPVRIEKGPAAMSIRVERSGPVTTVILSRPEARNAVDRATAEELADAFRVFDADPGALAGVLYGDHGTFCAGADLKAIAAGTPNRIEPEGDGPMGPTRLLLGKPVVAAIAGYAVAGGLELALSCDLRVMEEDAVLGVFWRRWGVPLIDGATLRLPPLIALARPLALIPTARPVPANA